MALTRSEDAGTGILKHGNEERNDDGWCEQILGSGKKFGPLPLPFHFVFVEVPPMTGPYGYVTVLQTFSNGVGT